jgi:predicted enzyme involved in methoxymalonyl-ACP biosynthesis
MNIVQVKDKFGDLGIVGLYLVEVNDAAARIDSFVLSCRALGRSIESCIMNNIKQDFLGSGKCATLQAQFCKTAKNMPASTFFADQGFVKTAGDENEQYYEMSSDSFRLLDCPGIDVQLQQEEQL